MEGATTGAPSPLPLFPLLATTGQQLVSPLEEAFTSFGKKPGRENQHRGDENIRYFEHKKRSVAGSVERTVAGRNSKGTIKCEVGAIYSWYRRPLTDDR